jgi:hypothetical protein
MKEVSLVGAKMFIVIDKGKVHKTSYSKKNNLMILMLL